MRITNIIMSTVQTYSAPQHTASLNQLFQQIHWRDILRLADHSAALIMANTMVAGATKKPALPTTSSGGEPQPTAEDWEQVEFTDYTTTPTTTASEADPVSPTATERSHWWQGVGLVRGAGFAVTVGPATPVVALSGALVGSMIGMIKDQNGRSAYEIMQELGYDDKIAFLVRLYDEFGRRYATLDFTSPVDLGDAGECLLRLRLSMTARRVVVLTQLSPLFAS